MKAPEPGHVLTLETRFPKLTLEKANEVDEEREFKLIFGALNMAISRGIRDGFERVRRQQEAGQVPR